MLPTCWANIHNMSATDKKCLLFGWWSQQIQIPTLPAKPLAFLLSRLGFLFHEQCSVGLSIHLPSYVHYPSHRQTVAFTHRPPFQWSAVADSGATEHMFPDKSSFISYKIVSGLQVRMGNNSYIPVLGCGAAIVALNGKRIFVRNSLHVPSLAVPLYSLRAHTRQPGCGFVASDTTGFLVYFPTFVLSVNMLVDCHLSYEPLGLCAPLETLHYAQPQCPPTYNPLELASASSTTIPSPTAPAFIKDDTLTVSMAAPPSLSPPLATESPVDLGSVSTQLQALAEAIGKISSTSAPSSPAPPSEDPPKPVDSTASSFNYAV
jgi:hypothetical protein